MTEGPWKGWYFTKGKGSSSNHPFPGALAASFREGRSNEFKWCNLPGGHCCNFFRCFLQKLLTVDHEESQYKTPEKFEENMVAFDDPQLSQTFEAVLIPVWNLLGPKKRSNKMQVKSLGFVYHLPSITENLQALRVASQIQNLNQSPTFWWLTTLATKKHLPSSPSYSSKVEFWTFAKTHQTQLQLVKELSSAQAGSIHILGHYQPAFFSVWHHSHLGGGSMKFEGIRNFPEKSKPCIFHWQSSFAFLLYINWIWTEKAWDDGTCWLQSLGPRGGL